VMAVTVNLDVHVHVDGGQRFSPHLSIPTSRTQHRICITTAQARGPRTQAPSGRISGNLII
jgi:hypothetical protein